MSAMSLCFPAIDFVSNGVAWWTCCHTAGARSRCPAMIDFDYDNRVVQATDGVLSHNKPM